jgi:predicted SAM-dependent methyltransferase
MHHSRNNVEIFCYSTLLGEDDFTDRFRKLAHNWRDISTLSQEKVVALIKNDGIDILVDLSGYTVGARLGVFSCKPAPIQITYLGHPTTTGLRTIDFRLGDEITDPTELTSSHYVERLWHMPGCFLTYQPPADAPSISPLPMLTNGYVTFGSFNNAAKINDDVIHAWASILSALPESRLLLKGHAFVSQHGRDRVSKELIRRGITQDRFELIEWRANIQNHLELYREIDIALDTFPYNGTTTTCEALWMGVPVVTLCGQRHSCRVGASLLTCLRMTELISESVSDYIACATALASDSERLEQIHNTLRDRMASSPLLDHVGFTRNLENIYRAMWKEWCAAAGYSNTEDKNHNGGLRLHIGGEDHKDGWTVLNITPGPNVDIVGDLKDLSNLRSGIVTEIYASHVLEHVDQQNIPVVLEELWRILQKPGGKLMISVPDMEVLCRMFLRKDLGVQGKLHVMRMIFGGQVDAHDYHQVGLYFEHLRDLLKSAGFHDIQRVESFGLFEDTSEYAPYGERISLNVIAIA